MTKEPDVKNWLKEHKQALLDTAIDGFDYLGRGAVIVDFSDPDKTTTIPDYISPDRLRRIGYKDNHFYRILANYDPIREVVIAVLLADMVKYYKLKAYPWAE